MLNFKGWMQCVEDRHVYAEKKPSFFLGSFPVSTGELKQSLLTSFSHWYKMVIVEQRKTFLD